MEKIEIKRHFEDDFEPSVNFDPDTGVCELAGESYLDYTTEFYEPLVAWLKDYFVKVNRPITFNFKLTYFNTSSSKHIYLILNSLKDYERSGGSVTVSWHFESESDELVYEVDDLKIASDLNINYVFGMD